MSLNRKYVTPLMAGAFLLSAVTGFLMFFDLASGLNKDAHEWLGFALVIGAILHIALNIQGLKTQLSHTLGKIIFGLFVVVLLGSFIRFEGEKAGKPDIKLPAKLLINTPIYQIAILNHTDSTTLINQLKKANINVNNEQQTIKDIAGDDFGNQLRTLNKILENNQSLSVIGND